MQVCHRVSQQFLVLPDEELKLVGILLTVKTYQRSQRLDVRSILTLTCLVPLFLLYDLFNTGCRAARLQCTGSGHHITSSKLNVAAGSFEIYFFLFKFL